MKILLVSYAYAPVQNPRSFRWTAITRHWAAQGHEVDVVCGSVAGQPDQAGMDGVHVHRVPWAGLAVLRDRFKALEPVGPDQRLDRSAKPPAWRSRLLRSMRSLWQFICWPDFACLWYPLARRCALRLAAQSRYDILISSSLPFTGHLVGLAVHSKHAQLPWIVDIGDPFSFRDGEAVANARMYRWLNLRVERKVFAAASAISVTTAGTARRYGQLFAEHAHRITVIPPLLSDAPAPPAVAVEVAATARPIRLVFVGTLYKALRSPDNLLRLFARLQQHGHGAALELHFYGNVASCMESFAPYRESLGLAIHLHGQVPRETAMAAMRQASVLVNIGNASSYQLPSKVVEYLAMNKPIINMVSSPDDSSAGFFSDFEAVLNLVQDEGIRDDRRFAEVLAFLGHRFAIDAQARARQLQAYGIDRIARDYLALGGRARPATVS